MEDKITEAVQFAVKNYGETFKGLARYDKGTCPSDPAEAAQCDSCQ